MGSCDRSACAAHILCFDDGMIVEEDDVKQVNKSDVPTVTARNIV